MDILTKQINKAKKEFEIEYEKVIGKYVHFDKNMNSIFKDGDGYKIKKEREALLEQSIRESVVAVVSELRMEKLQSWKDLTDAITTNKTVREHKRRGYNKAVIEFNQKIDNVCKK